MAIDFTIDTMRTGCNSLCMSIVRSPSTTPLRQPGQCARTRAQAIQRTGPTTLHDYANEHAGYALANHKEELPRKRQGTIAGPQPARITSEPVGFGAWRMRRERQLAMRQRSQCTQPRIVQRGSKVQIQGFLEAVNGQDNYSVAMKGNPT